MGYIRTFFLRLVAPRKNSYPPPEPSQLEAEAKLQHDRQMSRLKTALASRKQIQSSSDRISREFEKA